MLPWSPLIRGNPFFDSAQHPTKIVPHIGVQKAEHGDAHLLQFLLALLISRFPAYMRCSVNLNRQLQWWAVEIDYVVADRPLTVKVMATHLPTPELLPQQHLGEIPGLPQ